MRVRQTIETRALVQFGFRSFLFTPWLQPGDELAVFS